MILTGCAMRARLREPPSRGCPGHPLKINYEFSMEDGTRHEFGVQLDRPSAGKAGGKLPEWTKLTYHQCPNCPLKPSYSPRCPAAADLAPAIATFAAIVSY